MKKTKKLLAAVLAMVIVFAGLPMYGMEVKAEKNGDYQYSVDEGCITITKYLGDGGDVVIPSEIDGKSVTSIGGLAFSYCSSLTKVEIPNSVTSIGYRAFYGCNSLTKVEIPNSVTNIEMGAFYYCGRLTEVKFPNSVTSIGIDLFSGCSSLTKVDIPNSVTSIGDGAFYNCSSLMSITIPNSVTSIGNGALGYFIDANYQKHKILNFVIYGESGSAAETYAKENGFKFALIGTVIEDISKAAITLDKTTYTYNGKAKTPSVTVKLDGKTLALNTDYTVSYSDNTNAGTAKVTVTGIGNYIGSKTVNFTITKSGQDSSITCKKTLYKVTYGAKPFKINAASKSKLSFTSSKPKIASVDKNTGKVTIKNTGVATITVKAGKDSVKVTVKVSPKKQTVKSVKAVKGKKLTVGWAKDKMASGYQVQISAAKNFKADMKSKNVSKTSYTFTKLKTGKKYYVRVRSYKKSGKETLYGDWSKAKQSTKVKK